MSKITQLAKELKQACAEQKCITCDLYVEDEEYDCKLLKLDEFGLMSYPYQWEVE